MLRGFPRLRQWEETSDVLQGALLRLSRALEAVDVATPQDFMRLAALQIRRTLIDLARHHLGPEGSGAHHATGMAQPSADGTRREAYDRADNTREPSNLAAWAEFHEKINGLPDEERRVFDLLWYQEMSQPEAAHILGAQLNAWTEHMRLTQRIEHQAFPRVAALAEATWSPADARDWTSFQARLASQFARYRALGIDYADTAFEPLVTLTRGDTAGTFQVELDKQADFGELRYGFGAEGAHDTAAQKVSA